MRATTIHDLRDGTVVAAMLSSEHSTYPAGIPVLVPLSDLDTDGSPFVAAHDVVAWVDEAEVLKDPAAVLRRIARVRERGAAVALRPAAAASCRTLVLELTDPEVVVVPAAMLVASDTLSAAALLALRAHCERTNAVVLVEGTDSDLQRDAALAHGIEFGCGTVLSAYSGTADEMSPRSRLFREPAWAASPDSPDATPFRILSEGRQCRRSGKSLLVSMSTDLESRAGGSGPHTIALGTFQHRRNFTGAARDRWRSMSGTLTYVSVFALGFDSHPRGPDLVALTSGDPLVDEWNVIVLGETFACALSALDLHRRSLDGEREFEYVVSYDREAVARAARAILSRQRP